MWYILPLGMSWSSTLKTWKRLSTRKESTIIYKPTLAKWAMASQDQWHDMKHVILLMEELLRHLGPGMYKTL